MSSKPLAAALVVIYAQDIVRVARFYSTTLTWAVTDEGPRFVIVGGAGIEIAIVRMADDISKNNPISVPPRVREETPIKPSFLVEDLEVTSQAAHAAGGGTKPVHAAWRWRDQLHLDGYDPEGNAVQFRVLEPVDGGRSAP